MIYIENWKTFSTKTDKQANNIMEMKKKTETKQSKKKNKIIIINKSMQNNIDKYTIKKIYFKNWSVEKKSYVFNNTGMFKMSWI